MLREFDTSNGDEDYVEVRRRRDDEGTAADVQWLGLGKRQPRFTPYVSVGAYIPRLKRTTHFHLSPKDRQRAF